MNVEGWRRCHSLLSHSDNFFHLLDTFVSIDRPLFAVADEEVNRIVNRIIYKNIDMMKNGRLINMKLIRLK